MVKDVPNEEQNWSRKCPSVRSRTCPNGERTKVKDVPKWTSFLLPSPKTLSSEPHAQPGEKEGMPAREGCMESLGTMVF